MGIFSQRSALAFSTVRKAETRGPLPRLSQMVTFRTFAELRSSHGQGPLYDQTFIATDFLIQCSRPEALLQYFRLFAQSDDRLANFRAAFGKNPSTFEEKFALYLEKILHSTAA
jgi:hypothetical protein